MDHPLHLAVADEIQRRLDSRFVPVRDPACDGNHQIPLFVGQSKARNTRMCCVDLLVLQSKICGELLRAAFATQLIDDSLRQVVKGRIGSADPTSGRLRLN